MFLWYIALIFVNLAKKLQLFQFLQQLFSPESHILDFNLFFFVFQKFLLLGLLR